MQNLVINIKNQKFQPIAIMKRLIEAGKIFANSEFLKSLETDDLNLKKLFC